MGFCILCITEVEWIRFFAFWTRKRIRDPLFISTYDAINSVVVINSYTLTYSRNKAMLYPMIHDDLIIIKKNPLLLIFSF